jgi:hypothetical protein
MEGHRLPPAPRLADENNYLSRDSKMCSTGLASVGITRPAEKGRACSANFGHQSIGRHFLSGLDEQRPRNHHKLMDERR